MRTYPIMLLVADRLAVVVGAGPVGLRKASALVRAGACVRLVARDVPEDAPVEGVEVVRGDYQEDLLAGAFLVFACTDDRGLNARISRDARRAGALVNVADLPAECDFFLPATVRDGPVVVAVGTGGAAPAAAAWLKRRIAEALPPRVAEFLAALDEARAALHATVEEPSRRMAAMKALANDETYRAFLQDGPETLRRRLRERSQAPEET